MIWALSAGLGGLIIFLAFRSQRKRGQAEQAAKQSREVMQDVKKANDAERKLSDPIERKRVRDKFTRK